MNEQIRLAVDVGGTFTDVVLEKGTAQTTLKVLTTPAAPEQGVLAGIDGVLQAANLSAGDIDILLFAKLFELDHFSFEFSYGGFKGKFNGFAHKGSFILLL